MNDEKLLTSVYHEPWVIVYPLQESPIMAILLKARATA